MLLRFIKFEYYILYRYILQIYSNVLVKWHVRLTPIRSTEDSFREMLLEGIRWRQRLIEQKRWAIWTKMISLSKGMGNDISYEDISPTTLESEDILNNKRNENEII